VSRSIEVVESNVDLVFVKKGFFVGIIRVGSILKGVVAFDLNIIEGLLVSLS